MLKFNDELKTLVQKNFDGDSLTDDEYAQVALYWKTFHDVVGVCPQVVGKGCQQYVMNKHDETSLALQRRMERQQSTEKIPFVNPGYR